MFLNIARTLWGFNIDFKRDAKGEIIPVDFSLFGTEPGSNSTPKKFACCIFCYINTDRAAIKPRSEKHAQILRDDWAEAQKLGINIENIQFDRLLTKEEVEG
jgi:hypothetical protein